MNFILILHLPHTSCHGNVFALRSQAIFPALPLPGERSPSTVSRQQMFLLCSGHSVPSVSRQQHPGSAAPPSLEAFPWLRSTPPLPALRLLVSIRPPPVSSDPDSASGSKVAPVPCALCATRKELPFFGPPRMKRLKSAPQHDWSLPKDDLGRGQSQ